MRIIILRSQWSCYTTFSSYYILQNRLNYMYAYILPCRFCIQGVLYGHLNDGFYDPSSARVQVNLIFILICQYLTS